jgi:L-threonylcarbamoyladenylate synthase
LPGVNEDEQLFQVAFGQAVAALNAGCAVVIPTDTVYGIATFPNHTNAIYRIKKRDADKAIPWLVSGADALQRYGDAVPKYAIKLARQYWPGALTLIVDTSDEAKSIGAGDTIALRMPDNAIALTLIDTVGLPLATSSANLQGEPPALCACDLKPDVASQVAAIIDGGHVPGGVSSTIVLCTGGEQRIVREGPITKEDIECALQ